MKVNFLGRFPVNYEPYGILTELDDYDMKYLSKLELDEIWYWYSTAPYEGSGQILMRKGKLYDLHDAGHCSCYGPTERATFMGMSLEKLAQTLTDEYMRNEALELFELAGYNNFYKK